ncbi:uncharacterized protein EI90DRAFT_3156126 [Cantharellus anzutake]|uniref:uncharacterized protein n=1 Tax=Cantharellus anzutake TaxID=1750568 RepID=UPI0019083907|nr:uncharacterized protein EI90DRAFT_3156126 [Cantharellus anzutake]KAF8327579.1 hypothetical protein EI90DRAFT_3156126 [Cantharellus anzutake]
MHVSALLIFSSLGIANSISGVIANSNVHERTSGTREVRLWDHRSKAPNCPKTAHTESLSNSTLYLWAINAKDGYSYPECWAMQPNFTIPHLAGLEGTLGLSLGNGSAVGYNRWTKALNSSLHGPPANQYVMILTGSVLVHFPNVTDIVRLVAGQIIIAIDISSVSSGHYSDWAAGASAISVQFQNGLIPAHSVVNSSYCG